jgi:hypothetical protein
MQVGARASDAWVKFVAMTLILCCLILKFITIVFIGSGLVTIARLQAPVEDGAQLSGRFGIW